MKAAVSSFDVIFISYDEPRCEEFWALLSNDFPGAQRVHGVKGFDNAHKAAAKLSRTQRFFTVDGDTLVDGDFWSMMLEIPDDMLDCQFSWGARNAINGLAYGNGSVKSWTREFVLGMRTHENALEGEQAVEFCWDKRYRPVPGIFAVTYPNGSPFQAFRAGYREAVKLSLIEGKRIEGEQLSYRLPRDNYARLLTWCSVGADVVNGLWAIYGARLALIETLLMKTVEIEKISDFDWFDHRWKRELSFINPKELETIINMQGQGLRKDFGLHLSELDANQSAFFKHAYMDGERVRKTSQLVRIYGE